MSRYTLAGKLAPLFAVFTAMMFVLTFIVEGLYDIPFNGDASMMIVAAMLFIIAYLAIGALLQLLLRDLSKGLAVTGLIVSPAFGYAGVGFPILGMNLFAQSWSKILPLRWYMEVLFDQAARGLSVHESTKSFAFLAGLAALYMVLALLRLKVIGANTTTDRSSQTSPEMAPVVGGFGGAFAAEWRLVLFDRGAFSMMVVAPLIYGMYYPQPYLTQILRKIPIAVVDNDLSQLSRDVIDTVDASGTLSVAVRASRVLETRLQKNTLRSPADGIVQVVIAEPGEAIRAGQPVLTIETAGKR